jgi:hypothetical protein
VAHGGQELDFARDASSAAFLAAASSMSCSFRALMSWLMAETPATTPPE